MRKNLLSVLFVFILLIVLLPHTSLPASAEVYSGTCGENLTWTFDKETGILTISGIGEMADCTMGSPWSAYHLYIKSITIENGVTSIGACAFRNHHTVTEVILPDSLQTVEYCAFGGCTSLSNITIPDNVTRIEKYAFMGCKFTSLTIPSKLAQISDYAFSGCSSLLDVTIPCSITKIGESAFENCDNLLRVDISDLQAWCEIEFSNAFSNPLTSAHYLFLKGKRVKTLEIPLGTEKIGNYAFQNGIDLTNVKIPESVETIGNNSFFGCSALRSVEMSEGLLHIGHSAFSECDNLKTVSLPDGVTTIGSYAFRNCYSLEEVRIPGSVVNIGLSSFQGCESLIRLSIGEGVESIGSQAFGGCYSLVNIRIPDSVKTISPDSFDVCNSLETITFGSGLTIIPKNSFSGLPNLKWIYLPVEVSAIRTGAFSRSYLSHIFYSGSSVDWEEVLIEGDSGNIGSVNCLIHWNAKDYDSHVQVVAYHPVSIPPGRASADFTCPCGYKWTEYIDHVPATPSIAFTDVDADAYYYEPVVWAVENGITKGTDETHFSPNANCTRAQVVTFLWRAKGSPTPSNISYATGGDIDYDNPFIDVFEGAYYYNAVMWALETGITGGTSSTTFSPNTGCTRAQVVTFLWRAEGKPKATSTNNPFSDVKPSSYYYDAVLWAVANQITSGTSKTTFSPNRICTRGQIVTFLYRDLTQ